MLAVGPGLKTGMQIRYDNPREIGADRLVNAVAVRQRFGSPSVCVDFGTATTFDVVSRAGEYAGGALIPGIEITLDALTERGAKLPKIELRPRRGHRQTTVDAIRSGSSTATPAPSTASSRRLSRDGRGVDCIATGGWRSVVPSPRRSTRSTTSHAHRPAASTTHTRPS
jgi:type III pantothenate kinase